MHKKMTTMQFSNYELLKLYVNATMNEIAVDEFISGNKKFPALPRSGKWIEKNVSVYLLYFIYICLMCFFILGGFFIFSIACLMKDYFAYKKEKQAVNCTTIGGNFYIEISEIGSCKVSNLYKDDLNSICFITMPWCRVSSVLPKKSVSIFSLLQPRDYLRWAKLIFATYFYFIINPFRLKWFLQSYSASRWYIVALALSKLKGRFIISVHYDRWAVLIDAICKKNHNALTLVQHGSLKGWLFSSYKEFTIPYRLSNVSEIYVYDDIEYDLFLNNVLACNFFSPVIHYLPLTLELQPISAELFSILIIGHATCENEQLRLIELILSSVSRCVIYYKEHPKARASKSVSQSGVILIKEDNFFPDVNVVISYPSTLAWQYQEKNKQVYFHDLNIIDTSTSSNIIASIIEQSSKHVE